MAAPDPSKQQPPPQAKLNELVQEVLTLFMTRTAEAMSRTGVTQIEPAQLQGVIDRMAKGEDPALQKLYARHWDRLQAQFEHNFWARMRKYPLERLIVSRFADHLAPRDAEPEPGRTLSRRVIPAWIGALHQMVGPDLFDEYEDRARNLVEAVRDLEGEGFEWEKLYAHPQADVLVNDILVYIAGYFTDVPKRRAWLIGYMERNLAPAKSDAERRWIFDDAAFHLLIGALFARLARQLDDPPQRARLIKRYGQENIDTVEEMLPALDHDRRNVAPEAMG